jgi:hypothetical protein
MKQDHAEKTEQALSEHRDDLDALKAKHAKELADLKANMMHERETAMSELTTGHLAEMKAVHDSQEALVSKMRADFETNMAAKEQEHAKNM